MRHHLYLYYDWQTTIIMDRPATARLLSVDYAIRFWCSSLIRAAAPLYVVK